MAFNLPVSSVNIDADCSNNANRLSIDRSPFALFFAELLAICKFCWPDRIVRSLETSAQTYTTQR